MIWTEEMKERLMLLVMENISYTKIARHMTSEFGELFTKNACVGMSRRIGAPRRPPMIPVAVTQGEPVVMEDLKREMCRWPIGDSFPYLFCGEATEPGYSWCPVHRRMVYVKSSGSAKIFRPHY